MGYEMETLTKYVTKSFGFISGLWVGVLIGSTAGIFGFCLVDMALNNLMGVY